MKAVFSDFHTFLSSLQRLKELNKREYGRNVGAKRYKEERKREKEMKRITDFADKRAGK